MRKTSNGNQFYLNKFWEKHSDTHKNSGLPDLKGLKIVIIGLSETRNSFFESDNYKVDNFRKVFYELYPGNWSLKSQI